MKTFIPKKVTPMVFREIKHMLKQRRFLGVTYDQIARCKGVGLKTIQLVNRSGNYEQYVENVRKGKMNFELDPLEKLMGLLLIMSFIAFWFFTVLFTAR